MNYKQCWKQVYDTMLQCGIDEKSDVDLMFCNVLQCNRAELKLVQEIEQFEFEQVLEILKLRLQNVPLQRIFNKANFFGLDFELNADTLVPRFDTEILVEQVINEVKKSEKKDIKILDLCTGSGCIAITLAKHTKAKVYASDINENALEMAKQNAINNNVKVEFIKSNMFDNLPLNLKFDIIVSNPPYIPTADIDLLEKEVKENDPMRALDGGKDGFDFYKIIAKQAHNFLQPHGTLLLEFGENQSKTLANLLKSCYNNLKIVKDLQGNERVLVAHL